jgi:enoyl-CoA hydratase/carnithine racemase
MPNTLIINSPLGGVLCIKLNRPDALNALNTQLLAELADTLSDADNDDNVRAVVITGDVKAFAAGADIKEMAERDLVGMLEDPRQQHWATITRFRKPIIAAVNGYALGGGCELAMHADIIIAGANAQFGQPEINLGIMPGAGGTQRLLRAVGKSLATQMVLTGEPISARRALEEAGVNVPIVGLAKRQETIITERGDDVLVPVTHPGLKLLINIRDEAHRVAVTYNRKQRGNAMQQSVLDDVPGIGPARRKALLQRFGSVAALRGASEEELAAVLAHETGHVLARHHVCAFFSPPLPVLSLPSRLASLCAMGAGDPACN